MLSDLELIQYSLELDLYVTRIMMEHGMIVISSLTEKEEKYIPVFQEEVKIYQDVLKELLAFSNGKITKKFIDSNQLVTNYTVLTEEKTTQYFNVGIDMSITKMSKDLVSGTPSVTKENLEIVNDFNKKIFNMLLVSLDNLNEIDMEIKRGNTFFTIHPVFLDHIIDEVNIFKRNVERLLNKENLDPSYVYNNQYYYADIMREHSLLLKSLINPINRKYIDKTTTFISLYTDILKSFNNDISPYTIKQINEKCQRVTYSFLDFNELLASRVIKNESYLMILPLFIDHLLRESYHFLSQLDYYKNK